MNNYNTILIIPDSNAMNEVRNCLAECQYYSESITQRTLKKTSIDSSSLSLTEALALLTQRNDTTVTFYFLKSKGIVYIYSDFFHLNNSLNAILSSFDNLSIPLLVCKMVKAKMFFSVIINGLTKQCDTFEMDANLNTISNVYFKKSTMMQIASFIASNHKLSNSEMNNYLNSHCIFKDEYII